jgi:hypothetical protein
VIGIVGQDGRLGHISPALPVDADFVTGVQAGRTPESRFRFGEPCAEGRCGHWTGRRCGLIERLLASPVGVEAVYTSKGAPLPRCGIRSSCRWFGERGAEACGVCPLVVRTQRHPA